VEKDKEPPSGGSFASVKILDRARTESDPGRLSCLFARRRAATGDTTMLYRKNIYNWEQVARIAAGLALAVYSLVGLTGAAVYGLTAMGAFIALTGVVGFCAACAMVGRRLKEPEA
jgi:hypothetical protein